MMKMVRHEKGAVLLLSLVILLVLTLLAVSGMQGSIMQERMSTAQRDGLFALEIAESGMREAEEILDDLDDLSAFGTTSGYYDGTDSTTEMPSPYEASTWEDSDNFIEGTAVDGVTPSFMFEYKGTVDVDSESELPLDLSTYGTEDSEEYYYARIVVRASGPSGSSMRMLEGFYVFQPSGL